ncbi:enoyl-CoA hydratase [Alicyclobacillaceae bacterium I2511]|jgi:enoyl-CoA hydratase/carnithine racemase|nr:enoyl-CoA hydratase [Alicyclobacillaceae bacterium I2511]
MTTVRIEVNDGLATLLLDNPPLNVLSIAMAHKIREAVAWVSGQSYIFAVLVTGVGSKAFMAGADIKEFPSYIKNDNAENMAQLFDEVMTELANLSKPTVSVLNGLTLGGGLELALACDFRIAEAHAQLGFPEIKLGVFPGAGGTQRLPRLIGLSRAKEMIFSGDSIGAQQALSVGLVNRVVATGDGLQAARAWVQPFAQQSQVALARAKLAMNEGLDLPLTDGLHLEAQLFGEAFRTEDAREGVSAFIEKRVPVFRH